MMGFFSLFLNTVCEPRDLSSTHCSNIILRIERYSWTVVCMKVLSACKHTDHISQTVNNEPFSPQHPLQTHWWCDSTSAVFPVSLSLLLSLTLSLSLSLSLSLCLSVCLSLSLSLLQSLRKVGQDSTVLLICITVFLSYLPEAGQYSSFFLYLRQVRYTADWCTGFCHKYCHYC